MKIIFLTAFFFSNVIFANCSYTALTDIYINDKLENKKNYKIIGDFNCETLDGKISEVFIRKNRKINISTLGNIDKKVVINFNDMIYIEYNNSKLVSKNKNSIKIKKGNKIIKIKIKGDIL